MTRAVVWPALTPIQRGPAPAVRPDPVPLPSGDGSSPFREFRSQGRPAAALRGWLRAGWRGDDAVVGVAAVILTQAALALTVVGSAVMDGYSTVARLVPGYLLAALVGALTVVVLHQRRNGAAPIGLVWLNGAVMVPIGWWAATYPGLGVEDPLVDSFRWYQFAVVAVAVVVGGAAAGWLVLLGFAIPTGLLMVAVSPAPPQNPTVYLLDRVADLVVVVIAVQTLRILSRARAAAGRAEGRLAEQQRILRTVHDTALQALEAIAVRAEGDDERLPEIRGMARREALALRRLLAADSPDSAADLVDQLRRLAEDFEARGLSVELVGPGPDGVPLPAAEVDALVGAAGEALTNVVKHARTTAAVLRIQAGPDDVVVTVRDQGQGFDLDRPSTGFGLAGSIRGRLAEVGGQADVWSRPGRGTRVTLRITSRTGEAR